MPLLATAACVMRPAACFAELKARDYTAGAFRPTDGGHGLDGPGPQAPTVNFWFHEVQYIRGMFTGSGTAPGAGPARHGSGNGAAGDDPLPWNGSRGWAVLEPSSRSWSSARLDRSASSGHEHSAPV